MNILVLGRAIPHQPGRSTGQQLAEGFQQAGHNAIFFGSVYDDWESIHNPNKCIGIEECRQVDKWDLVIQTEMNDGMPDYAPLLQSPSLKDVPSLYWDFDISYNESSALRRAGTHQYNAYLVGNKDYVDRISNAFQKPAIHLGYAFSPQYHKPHVDPNTGVVDKPYLMGFIGTMTPERKGLVEQLGNMLNPEEFLFREGIYGDDLVALTSKMAIMFHRNQDACKGLTPGRPWETIGCGTTLMMDRISYEDFMDFFPISLHNKVLVYDNNDDIKFLVNQWQDEKELLYSYGKLLREHGLENHTYKHRAEAIMEFARNEKLLL